MRFVLQVVRITYLFWRVAFSCPLPYFYINIDRDETSIRHSFRRSIRLEFDTALLLIWSRMEGSLWTFPFSFSTVSERVFSIFRLPSFGNVEKALLSSRPPSRTRYSSAAYLPAQNWRKEGVGAGLSHFPSFSEVLKRQQGLGYSVATLQILSEPEGIFFNLNILFRVASRLTYRRNSPRIKGLESEVEGDRLNPGSDWCQVLSAV